MNVDPVWWVALVFSSILINIGIMIYFLYAKLEKTEEILFDVNFICWYKNFYDKSLIGRQARMNAISMIVMMPELMQKRGEVSREAYLRLPPALVIQIRTLYLFMFSNCLAMIGLYVFVY